MLHQSILLISKGRRISELLRNSYCKNCGLVRQIMGNNSEATNRSESIPEICFDGAVYICIVKVMKQKMSL